MVWGQIAGAVVGGYMANQAAKKQASAMDRANALNNQGYTDARPYITDVYSRGQDALNRAIDTGAYQGQTYAGMNPFQTEGYNAMAGLGSRGLSDGSDFMNMGRGFGQNYANLYNTASSDMLGNAVNYASDPSNYRGLVDSAMRDSRRNLEENTLRGIDMNASATGNTNSSRAGIADAIAMRAFDDRQADVTSDIQSNLIDRSLNAQQARLDNMTNANQNLANLYATGFDQSSVGADMRANAGAALQLDQQNMLDDDRARFERNRDFEMDMLNSYNAGILGQAPRSPSGYTANTVSPSMAALSGAIGGFGLGGRLQNYFTQPRQQQGGGYRYGAGNAGSFERGRFNPNNGYGAL